MKSLPLFTFCIHLIVLSCTSKPVELKTTTAAPVDTTGFFHKATAQYTMFSPLIKNTQVMMEDELIYSPSGYLVYQNSKSCSMGAPCFVVKLTYDTLGHIIVTESYQSNKLQVHQEDTYNDKNDLLREYRIEEAEEGVMDTTLYEYIYYYGKPGAKYKAYRLNNGDTVTLFTIQQKGMTKTTREEPYPHKNELLYILKKELYDEHNNVIEIYTESVMTNWSDKTKKDTMTTLTRNIYNAKGQKTKERVWQDDELIKSDSIIYERDMIKRRLLTHRGKFQKITFVHSIVGTMRNE